MKHLPLPSSPATSASKLRALQLHEALEEPVVCAALFEYEGALAKRESLLRKLAGGEALSNPHELTLWNKALDLAENAMCQLARRNPILNDHPAFARATLKRKVAAVPRFPVSP